MPLRTSTAMKSGKMAHAECTPEPSARPTRDWPMASNPNLRAQTGLFTYLRDGHIVAVDEYLASIKGKFTALEEHVPLPWLRRLTLPARHAAALLRFLSYSGIHGASMYPGYEGVVRRLREEGLWATRTDAP